MHIFGFEISRKSLQPVSSRGWFPVLEASAGAWQRGEVLEAETALAHSAVWSCVNRIASDVSKLPLNFTERTGNYWAPTAHPYDRLMRKPNGYQNRLQFVQAWMASKLLHGNAYILKARDPLGRIIALHVLDPRTVRPLVSDDGAVFYQLKASHLHGIGDVTVPAREIMHDRCLAPFHPLVGVSPLVAAALATSQGLAIQRNSAKFFNNGAQPGGLLTAPGQISPETADRLKKHWEDNYSGDNSGKTAVLGDGLKYEAMTTSPIDAQLIEQLAFTAQDVARAFSVPAWKIGAGPSAPYTSSEATNLQYLSDCLQTHLESFELCLDEGLDLPPTQRTELDESALLRLDTATRINVLTTATSGGLLTINEARAELNRAPVEGGDQILRQLQDVALNEVSQND